MAVIVAGKEHKEKEKNIAEYDILGTTIWFSGRGYIAPWLLKVFLFCSKFPSNWRALCIGEESDESRFSMT